MRVLEDADIGLPKLRTGKVREVFEAGDDVLIVATDRISAFDCVLPSPIPGKGRVLSALSAFWFRAFADIPNHLLAYDDDEFPGALRAIAVACDGRAMLVRRANPLPVEWVVRGYLAGSGWTEYRNSGSICGVALPVGMSQSQRLPEPILTPTTKSHAGHDQPITWEQAVQLCGKRVATTARDYALALYARGAAHAESRGILLADTKFEFGIADGSVLLIDECMTPDSSRFWPMDEWETGGNPPSFDKQFVRDYLESLGWDKQPPAPPLPDDVIQRTAEKYEEALSRLTTA